MSITEARNGREHRVARSMSEGVAVRRCTVTLFLCATYDIVMTRTVNELEVMLGQEMSPVDRFNLLLELDGHAAKTEFQRSADLCREALQIAMTLSDEALEANALLRLSTALWKVGDVEESRMHALRGLELCERMGDRRGIALACGSLGIAHGILEDYAVALDFFERSARIAEELGAELILAHALGNIGSVHRSLQEYPAALRYLSRSLAIHQQLGDAGMQGVSNMLQAIAGVMVFQGEFDGAVTKLNEALSNDERSGNLRGKVVGLHNLGVTYLKWGRHGDAITHLNSSLALSERTHLLSQKPETHLMLSRAYQAIGETDEAVHHMNLYRQFGKEERRQRLNSVPTMTA